MTKKIINKFFSVITMNLNWEILTKNLVALKDGFGLRMKNFNIIGGLLKNLIFRRVYEKPIYRGELPKRGAWTVCRFKRSLAKKRGVVF